MTYSQKETIAAIATPPGDGGVAIVRVSGDLAIDVVEKVYSGQIRSYQSHHAHFGRIIDLAGVLIDEVLVLVMLAPRSYTGETTVEIHCHGGHLVTQKVLATLLKSGARPALPGEFTYRAFMNGKLDLSQAEAVQTLIGSKNDLSMQAASKQLQGRLSRLVQEFKNTLTDIAATLEAWVDFPEEDLEFSSMEDLVHSLQQVREKIHGLQTTFHRGRVIDQGISICLSGRPNVGKSSLMNALLGKDRAIVTDIPGTTRDLLEADLRLGSLHVRLIDTAGIRDTEEAVETEGIRRAELAMQEADLVLLVLDASAPFADDPLLSATDPARTLVVWNKTDLTTDPPPFDHYVPLSVKQQTGFDVLYQKIDELIWKGSIPNKDEIIITQERHHLALEESILALDQVIAGLRSGVSPEFLASDMRATLRALGKIIGSDLSEDILNAIFSKFCVGK